MFPTPHSVSPSRMKHACLKGALSALATLGLLHAPAATAADDLMDLDLDALSKVEVKSVGLTKTDARNAPAAVTTIDARTIRAQGVRDLNDIIEIETPNVQLQSHHANAPHIGVRGIISDREDKYLYLVNGRVMNQRAVVGAENERDLPLLGDINTVSVVRGPASATHGAGALAGVIGVETYNGLTFQGADFQARQGVIDYWSSFEGRYGKKFSDDSGIFAYYGIADQDGASNDDAPHYYGRSFTSRSGIGTVPAGTQVPYGLNRHRSAGFDELRHKAHISYVKGPFEVWARFTQSGHAVPPVRQNMASAGLPAGNVNTNTDLAVATFGRQMLYRQFTAAAKYDQQVNDKWKLLATVSYDFFTHRDHEASVAGNGVASIARRFFRENELYARALAVWTPNEDHSLAFGTDFSYEMFHTPLSIPTNVMASATGRYRWDTATVSPLMEYQWNILPQLTLFASARADKHTYTDYLISPRGTIVWTPTDADTVKFMGGRSIRRAGDQELRQDNLRGNQADPEELLQFEGRYERTLGKQWKVGAAAYYSDYSAIGWTGSRSEAIGNFTMAGGELEVAYVTDKTRFQLSHGYVQLLDSSSPTRIRQAVSASPYGFGDNLANWSSHITKFSISHDISEKWSANTSLRLYWGFDGAQDQANLHQAVIDGTAPNPENGVTGPRGPFGNFALTDRGYDVPFGATVLWNIGVEYRATKNLAFRVDGFNLADLFGGDVSKRNYINRMSEWTVEPASAVLSARLSF
jgi:outer membrane receptor protein involved in Fe transport